MALTPEDALLYSCKSGNRNRRHFPAAPGTDRYLSLLASATTLVNGSDLDNQYLLLRRLSHFISNCTSLDREKVFLGRLISKD